MILNSQLRSASGCQWHLGILSRRWAIRAAKYGPWTARMPTSGHQGAFILAPSTTYWQGLSQLNHVEYPWGFSWGFWMKLWGKLRDEMKLGQYSISTFKAQNLSTFQCSAKQDHFLGKKVNGTIFLRKQNNQNNRRIRRIEIHWKSIKNPSEIPWNPIEFPHSLHPWSGFPMFFPRGRWFPAEAAAPWSPPPCPARPRRWSRRPSARPSGPSRWDLQRRFPKNGEMKRSIYNMGNRYYMGIFVYLHIYSQYYTYNKYVNI